MKRSSRLYYISIILILLLATVLRFYNYGERWALASDQGRDALMGRYIATEKVIPLVGPFSQAGSVVMGPTWYLMVAGATLLKPELLLAPWIVLTMTFVVTVYIMIKIGEELDAGPYLPLLLGTLTAVSPSEIRQSVDLTNPSAISILAAMAAYMAIRFIKTRSNVFAFLFPFFVSLAAHTHLQAAGLVWLIPVAFALGKPKRSHLVLGFVGFLVPFLTILPFELQSNFYDTRNFLLYIFHDQYRITSSTRWLTYAGTFWPGAWGRIIGGYPLLGYALLLLTGGTMLILALGKKLTRPVLFPILTLLLIGIHLRYFRGSLFDGYLVFTHPFVLTITGLSLWQMTKVSKRLGAAAVIIIVLASIVSVHREILFSTNLTPREATAWTEILLTAYPNETFALYDYTHKYTGKTYPLSLYLYKEGKTSQNGRKIGFAVEVPSETATLSAYYPAVAGKRGGYQLFDLSASSSAQLADMEWHPMSPEILYDNGQNFFRK